ncbi:hypothetical protein ACFVW5_39055 [Streptomyces sp. NPDC058232]
MSDANNMSSCERELPDDRDEPESADAEGADRDEPSGYEPL